MNFHVTSSGLSEESCFFEFIINVYLGQQQDLFNIFLQAFHFPFLILLCRAGFCQANQCTSDMARTATCFTGLRDFKCSSQAISASATDHAMFITVVEKVHLQA